MDRRTISVASIWIAAGSVTAGTLVVQVGGVRDTSGWVALRVHDSGGSIAKGTPKHSKAAKPLQPMTEFVIPEIREGRWAFLAFQDLDRNGTLTHGWNRLPKEPMAFSNGFRPGIAAGMPDFHKLAVTIDSPVDTIRMDLAEFHLFGNAKETTP